jgi:type IV secretory pathway VirB4 component
MESTYPPNSTQQFVDVEEIKDGIVFLRSGGLRAVVMVAGTNFELKSEEEQDGITGAYQNFLNALDFSIQIIVHSRKLNINSYLEKMAAIREKETNELLRNQASEYIEFIRSFVKENEIMTKNFFVVVPYEGAGLGELKKGALSLFSFGKKKNTDKEKQESMEQKVSQLRQRVDEVLNGLERAGLRAVVLNDEELLELYYNLYNPESTEKNLPTTKTGTK